MQSLARAILSRGSWIFAVTCLACASSTPNASMPRAHWMPGYVFGIWGKAEFDVRDDCPSSGASSVRIGATWSTVLVSVATIGIYTPREVRVRCKALP